MDDRLRAIRSARPYEAPRHGLGLPQEVDICQKPKSFWIAVGNHYGNRRLRRWDHLTSVMGKIITAVEAIEAHFRRCATEARRRFGRAVRPLYVADERGRPNAVASAVLLDIDGSRFLATAAHVLNTSGLLIGGEPDLIPLSGDFYRSNGKGAPDDKIDLAVTFLSDDQRRALKGLPFIRAGDMLHSTLTENRYQLTVGYRASQNKAPIDGSKDLQPTRWSFTGFSASLPSSNGARKYSDRNFALQYSKRAVRESGELVRTTPPRGLSGGPIFDLGDTLSYDQLCAPNPHPAKLAGILIEYPTAGGALIGTKIEVLRDYAHHAKSIANVA